jgi:hypothetical protein
VIDCVGFSTAPIATILIALQYAQPDLAPLRRRPIVFQCTHLMITIPFKEAPSIAA